METNKSIPLRPLGLVMNVVEQMGLQVTYAYDDLIFVEHNAFLLRMEEDPNKVSFFFNVEADPLERPTIEGKFVQAGQLEGLSIEYKGEFSLEASKDEQIKIIFK